MVREPTVLVLGAGASKPYGFPLGKDLKEEIWQTLRSVSDEKFLDDRRKRICDRLRSGGFGEGEMFTLSEKLQNSPRSTIDSFLECQPRFAKLGKALIALELISWHERPDGRAEQRGDWYPILYESLGRSLSEWNRNQLWIITFNYDRSLEDFLIGALQIDFDLSLIECERRLYDLGLVHLHGALPSGVTSDTIADADLEECINGLRVISEQGIDSDPQVKRARELIREASRIYFLGFGYDERNVRRLGISNQWPPGFYGAELEHPPPPQKTVFGTTFQMTPIQIERASRVFEVSTSFPEHLRDLEIHDYLQQSGVLG